MRKYKGKIIFFVVIIFVLTASFVFGGKLPSHDNKKNISKTESSLTDIKKTQIKSQKVISSSITQNDNQVESKKEIAEPQKQKKVENSSNVVYSESTGMSINKDTGKDEYKTEPVPEGKPVPVEPENAQKTDKKECCTLSVSCKTILDNINSINAEKRELVPSDGIVFPCTEVTFYEGESVFNVLQREMKKAKIHMEFSNTPIYNSCYIEGINNLYEFDCGELSGWMYRVNNWFPNYGCSRYKLKAGDKIEFLYTCNLGRDVGEYMPKGTQYE